MEMEISDVVLSLAGRDRGLLFYVVGVQREYLLLANGKQRPWEKPKRKKAIHVRKVPRTESRIAGKLRSGEKVLNSELRRDLAALRQAMQQSKPREVLTWPKTT